MSKTAAQYKEEGNAALSAKKYDEAIAAYTEAISLDPKEHTYYSNRSAAYLSKGDAEHAYEDGCKCIELNPNWSKGYSRKGAALHAMKDYAAAATVYEEGLSKFPDDAALKSSLAEVQKLKASSESSGGFGGPGGGLFGPQMLAKLAGHPKFGPKIGDPQFMAKLQMMQKNPQMMMQDPEMMEILQAMISGMGGMGGDDEDSFPMPQRPSQSSNNSSSSSSSSNKKREPEPEVELTPEEKEAKAIRDKANAAKERGNALYKEKKFTEAIACYDEAFSIDNTNILFKGNVAAVYIEMGEPDRAIQICEEALEHAKVVRASFDDRAKIYQRIAGAHMKKKDLDTAIEFYKKSQMEKYDKLIEKKIKDLELESKKAKIAAYVNPELGLEAKERGNVAFREGNFPKAIEEYEEAIKRDPTNAPYYNNLAAAFLKMGVFNDAKKMVEKSLELDRNYVKAWAKKGDIEFYMKEYHKAMDSYRAGLQIEPDNALCRDGLRKVTEKVNETNGSSDMDADRAAHAMADPEIQAILRDPIINQVLSDLQNRPKYGQDALKDPSVRAKIEKLIAAGILKIG